MINRKLVETPVKMMNRMEEMTDLICEYNEEVQKQQQEIERLNNIIKEVKEYIEENASQFIDEYGYIKTEDKMIYSDEILEILDKGE